MSFNFKYYSPLQRLNAGLYEARVFDGESKINLFGGRRYHRFAACKDAFRDKLLGLNYILRRIGDHFQLTYHKDDRLNYARKHVQNTVLLELDLEALFLKMKEIFDCAAFFVPFYYRYSLKNKVRGVIKDARDMDSPWSFRSMRNNFLKGTTRDREFVQILKDNYDWMEDVLWKRDILYHKFHNLSISQDYWTNSCFAFLYEFNKTRDFIPDTLSYVSVTYFKLIKFLEAFESHFKAKCEKEISDYKYFHEGSSYSNKIDKVHYFFASLGRILDGRIVVRIHPELRHEIPKYLNRAIDDLNIKCIKCKQYTHRARPTTESYLLISAHCKCGNRLYLGNAVSKRFMPHFFDRNRHYWDIVPDYRLEERVTF